MKVLLTRLAYLLFFLMLTMPAMSRFFYVKLALFAFLLYAVAVQGIRGFRLHTRVVVGTLALSSVGLIFGLRGLLLGTPGALSRIELLAIWPLVYLLLLSEINSVRVFQGLERTMVFSSVFIALFGFFLALSTIGVLPGSSLLKLLFSASELDNGLFLGFAFADGNVGLAYTGLMSDPFLVPFLIAAVVCRPSGTGIWMSKRRLLLALIPSLVIVVLSGRRALQLVTMLSPLFILIFAQFQPRKERKALRKSLTRGVLASLAVMVLSIVLISQIFGDNAAITAEGLDQRFSSGFDFSASNRSDSSVGRIEQYMAMMEGWQDNPFIGNGLGASAHASIRSDTQPWAYELSYMYLLFETGVLGSAAYAIGITWIYWSGIMIIKRGGAGAQFMVPTLVGLTGMLVANATNPYLSGFDGMWSIFLPLAFINHWLLTYESQEPRPERPRVALVHN